MDLGRLERYREIIPDWQSFLDASQAPLPATAWANTLRVSSQRVRAILAAEGIETESLSWYPNGFRTAYGTRPGKTLAYATGVFHIQEEVSMMPVAFLDPQPGERVLDLCSAPGNKTIQAAIHMAGTGSILANDINRHRLGMVVRNLERLGLTNVALSEWNGSNLPAEIGEFDRVLADVPCTCEGTSRKNPDLIWREEGQKSDRWSGVQLAILRKAVQRCRPDGRIVYSTCTYAPEENEEVVDAVLREYADEVRLLPARLDGFVGAPGLTEWRGQSFRPELGKTLRAYPHLNDSGGFFVAVLEKTAGTFPEDPR
ncbi:MAG: RsmB/NOP family class I SAM-dependent RNA methyltransferase [Thermoanaerobaculia bacterium]|nr:RsmB/NOP family class I SAM-dependent RNA methyltransferase [Thermoanaerobaculia bacterium]